MQTLQARCGRLAGSVSCPHRRGGAVVLSKHWKVQASRRRPIVRAEDKPANPRQEQILIAATAVALASVATLSLTVFREPLEDFFYNDSFAYSEFGVGDAVGAVLWGVALYFISPLQLLLLFLGKIDTDRPSDWVIRQLGVAMGYDVDAIDYEAPLTLRMVALTGSMTSGVLVSYLLHQTLGDPTWAVSTGLGSCFAAGVYEVGRPSRMSVEEAQQLDLQYQDFAGFADRQLQRYGRCHETEIFRAFRRANAKYRAAEALPDIMLRKMIRNWNPDCERSPNGYYRNVSVRPTVDAFTGQVTGYDGAPPAARPRNVATPPPVPQDAAPAVVPDSRSES